MPDSSQPTPDPSQHSENRNFIESILQYIPGFSGYLEKEYRRESDQLARNWMADRLQQSKSGLDEFILQLTDAGQIDALPKIERFKATIDKMITKFRGDVQGYSGFFDYVRIGEEQLEQVYELDQTLMAEVAALADSIQQAKASSDAALTVVADLDGKLDAIEAKYGKRADMLNGLGD